ncbi:hypothetical protein GCM10023195_68790 [Actinoallomurus liliacearum]|uniref:Uncharacterized protein n=1 Tax=Actinoallomurus liliacearum TaxID=1080073 RepID=A0ABP8TWV6_9ACTN
MSGRRRPMRDPAAQCPAPAGVLLVGMTLPRQDDWGDDSGVNISNENNDIVGSAGGTIFG